MLSPILQLIRRVGEDERTRGASDQDLLQEFIASRDDGSFQALLRRHGPMVLDVCRTLLPNECDVEDAFQATFLILACKASSIRKTDALSSWLHGVAYRTALKARAAFARRQKHEARAPERSPATAADLSWGEVKRLVHEELNRLSEQYRAPLVLCYLEGKGQDEAARLLGLAKGTLKRRLERGRTLLRLRLERRGLGPSAVLLASAWPAATASAGLAPALVIATVRTASLRAAGPAAAPLISAQVAALADGVMRTMFFTKTKAAAVATVLLAVLVLGGGTFCWQGPGAENGRPAQTAADPGRKQQDKIAKVVDRFVERLKKDPARRPIVEDMLGLHLMDVRTRDVTLIAGEVDQVGAYCGSPCWSNDGRRILFDASPGQEWTRTRLQILDGTDGKVRLSSFGPGNCPTISPDGKHIAYLLNPGSLPPTDPDAEPGLHVMKADGSDQRWLGATIRIPKWSPDGGRLLTVSFTSPCQLTLLNVESGEDLPVHFPDHKVYSVPAWAGNDTIVAVVRSEKGVAVALVDLSNPKEAKLKETLWKKGDGLDVDPAYPVYSPSTRRGFFVGREPKGQALYAFDPGKAPQQLEPKRYDGKIASLALSPDGRYLLFCSERSQGVKQSGR